MYRLHVGERWASLKCTAIIKQDDDERLEFDGFGRSALVYRLLCDCGQEIEVATVDFKGKRVTRDCGCGAGDKLEHSDIRYRLPNRIIEMIRVNARNKGISVASSLADLIEIGWQETINK